ncbi:MAG: hypothetical protein ACJ8AH_10365 [Stellaceae bacterium]
MALVQPSGSDGAGAGRRGLSTFRVDLPTELDPTAMRDDVGDQATVEAAGVPSLFVLEFV